MPGGQVVGLKGKVDACVVGSSSSTSLCVYIYICIAFICLKFLGVDFANEKQNMGSFKRFGVVARG